MGSIARVEIAGGGNEMRRGGRSRKGKREAHAKQAQESDRGKHKMRAAKEEGAAGAPSNARGWRVC